MKYNIYMNKTDDAYFFFYSLSQPKRLGGSATGIINDYTGICLSTHFVSPSLLLNTHASEPQFLRLS